MSAIGLLTDVLAGHNVAASASRCDARLPTPSELSYCPRMPYLDYRFGRYRLVAASREFWHDDALVAMPRLVFDCLAYLIEHRDRAVGRNELVAAVWGRVEVSDGQVNQLILRVRRAFADDSTMRGALRTVPGFGYRWSIPIDVPETPAAEFVSPVDAAPATKFRRRSGRWTGIALIAIAFGGLLFAFLEFTQRQTTRPREGTSDPQALAVLPLEVSGPQDASWVRLGAMDLVAERLRSAGFAVAPSEAVLLALRDDAGPNASREDGHARLIRRLGTGAWIAGAATRTAGQWQVDLSATAADGIHHVVTTTDDDAIVAARRAADLLAAAYGRPPQGPDAGKHDNGLEDRLQQAQAALLAGKLETAGTILRSVPAPLQNEPRIRFGLAQVDVRLGRIEAGIASYTDLLGDAIVQTDPRLHGRVLSSRGSAYGRLMDFGAAERDLDAAVAVLQQADAPLDLARALNQRGVARTGLHRYDEAATDLGRARIQFQQAGDRLGLIQSDANRGLLEAERGRIEQALPYLTQAAERFEAFGAPERAVSTWTAVFDAQTAVLRWQDALVTTERQLALRDRVGRQELSFLIEVDHALALTKLGRLREAKARLGELKPAASDDRMPNQFRYALEAELAFADRRFDEASASAERALDGWPDEDPGDSRRARVVLLRQRAVFALAQPSAYSGSAAALAAANAAISPVLTVAYAESKAQQNDAKGADHLFRSAWTNAQSRGVPADVALVAVAYATWLLAQERLDDAIPLAGQIAPWTDRDFDCALLQLAVLHAGGRHEAWAAALAQAKALAGEREIPTSLSQPPTSTM